MQNTKDSYFITLSLNEMKQLSYFNRVLSVDREIGKEMSKIIHAGVCTLECCCGHGKKTPWCLIMAESYDLCIDLGYKPVKEADGIYKIKLRGEKNENNPK